MLNAVSYQNNVGNMPSFGCRRLLPVQVKAAKWKSIIASAGLDNNIFHPEKCYFSQLTEEDLPALSQLEDLVDLSDFGGKIVKNFNDTMSGCKITPEGAKDYYFVLDSDLEEGSFFRAKAFAQALSAKKYLKVSFLQSASEYNGHENVIGGGTAMLYGLCRLAEKLNKEYFTLAAAKNARAWYDKFGMQKVAGFIYTVWQKDYGVFLKNLEKRLGIKREDFVINVNDFMQ